MKRKNLKKSNNIAAISERFSQPIYAKKYYYVKENMTFSLKFVSFHCYVLQFLHVSCKKGIYMNKFSFILLFHQRYETRITVAFQQYVCDKGRKCHDCSNSTNVTAIHNTRKSLLSFARAIPTWPTLVVLIHVKKIYPQ